MCPIGHVLQNEKPTFAPILSLEQNDRGFASRTEFIPSPCSLSVLEYSTKHSQQSDKFSHKKYKTTTQRAERLKFNGQANWHDHVSVIADLVNRFFLNKQQKREEQKKNTSRLTRSDCI